ncbi:MAG: triose-phosphate isomerase [Nitrosomonas sp.]|nr:triose-phosphate isomerase [Nitrosomonas sp.]MDP1952067.1 triose-phosphate isomerase [Nitrosomonas sp.]
MRKKLVAGNWKMHGNKEQNQELLNAIIAGMPRMRSGECVVCVPYPYLSQVQLLLQNTFIKLGAQNVNQFAKGAYTGEVSAEMLNDFGCHYVIVGHSERRAVYGENDQTVALKYAAAQKSNMVPILCVGETSEQREADVTEQVIFKQLNAVIENSGVSSLVNAVIAYEPVWAIGTGKTATPQQAQDVHSYIRKSIAMLDPEVASALTILYGGSVKADNASQLFAMPDIDGGLIGGASLIATDFISICQSVQN